MQKFASDDLRVYVVWQRILRNDAVNTANIAAEQVFSDKRVSQMWDPANALGFWYKKSGELEHKDPMVWDAYFLYGEDAEWKDAPTGLIDAGYTVWNMKDKLLKSVATTMETVD
ncbi:MAG: hypothetical protein OXO51_13115 [Gemmatimonadota bacterium]|nr:hypothetical protein [Gemmatimonadota bacterium]MDE2847646.1 hypothetical protein [Gemmatimonadota bacterium]